MNELIKVTYNDDRITVSARDLYNFLELESNFTTWFKRMCEYGFEEGKDFIPFLEESTGGRPSTDYQLTSEMAKEISMIQRNEKGKLARGYFIACEKKLKEQGKLQNDPNKSLIAQSKMMNARARVASIWLKLSERAPIGDTEYPLICNSYASEVLTGQKVLPLPTCSEHYYSATEIAKMIGSSANMVGKKAKEAGIRPKNENEKSENGKWFFDKSQHSHKEVSVFKYNETGMKLVKELFEGK